MKKILYLALLCLSSGCVRVIRSAPSFAPVQAQTPQGSYAERSVSATGRGWGKVNGKAYSLLALREYYVQSGSLAALAGLDQALADTRASRRAWWMAPAAGVLVGYGVSALRIATGAKAPLREDQEEFGPGEAWVGLLIGVVSAPVIYFCYQASAKEKNERAAKIFNQDLSSRLKLTLAPLPGGAKAGASLKF